MTANELTRDEPTDHDWERVWHRLPADGRRSLRDQPIGLSRELFASVIEASDGIIVVPTLSDMAGVEIGYLDEGFRRWIGRQLTEQQLKNWWADLHESDRIALLDEPGSPCSARMVPSSLQSTPVAYTEFLGPVTGGLGTTTYVLPLYVQDWIADLSSGAAPAG